MRLVLDRPSGIKVSVVAAGVVAVCGLWWTMWVREHLHPSFGSLALPEVGAAVEKAGASTAGAAVASVTRGSSWVASLFHPAPADLRQRALAQLEAAGLPLTGEAWTRTVATGHRPLIDLFLQAGGDVNATAEDGRTGLLIAALAKNWPLADALLTAGADVNRADADGLTPLMAAALADHQAALRVLLTRGAALDATDAHGHTATHYAVAARSLGAFTALLHAGAPVTGVSEEGRTLLAHALDTGDWRFVQPVLELQPAPLEWAPATRNALAFALEARDATKVRLLLSKHTGVPTPEGSAQPLLAHLLVAGDLERFRLLLDCGVSPNTPLSSPVDKVFSDAVPAKHLRHYLATEQGMTTLMLAAGLGQTDFVRALLEKGATRGIYTKAYKMSALEFATRADNIAVAQVLIPGSPDPSALRIEVSLGSQRATLYKNGIPAFSTSISSGKSGFATPSGDFVVTDKHRTHTSTIYHSSMPFFMRLSSRAFGLHQGVVPGYPASHGCVRVPAGNAAKLFAQVPVGTFVSIRR